MKNMKNKFMDVLIPILKTCEFDEISQQKVILNQVVDLFLVNIHQDYQNVVAKTECIIIEYDEIHCDPQKVNDRQNIKQIMNHLKKKYEGITVIRVNQKVHYSALKFIISHYAYLSADSMDELIRNRELIKWGYIDS